MRFIHSIDKLSMVLGLCVIAIGSFVHVLLMVLGGMIVFSGVVVNLVERWSAEREYKPEYERGNFMRETANQ